MGVVWYDKMTMKSIGRSLLLAAVVTTFIHYIDFGSRDQISEPGHPGPLTGDLLDRTVQDRGCRRFYMIKKITSIIFHKINFKNAFTRTKERDMLKILTKNQKAYGPGCPIQ